MGAKHGHDGKSDRRAEYITLLAHRSRGGQFAVMPPSITNSLPVIQAASSDAK